MRQQYFGDSYDIVKRFFCSELHAVGLKVYARPMFPDPQEAWTADFYKLVGAQPEPDVQVRDMHAALLVDPDTGVKVGDFAGRAKGTRHITTGQVAKAEKTYGVVCVFDQSFSRGGDRLELMRAKLSKVGSAAAFYYASHATFLFAGGNADALKALRTRLATNGVPESRIVARSDANSSWPQHG